MPAAMRGEGGARGAGSRAKKAPQKEQHRRAAPSRAPQVAGKLRAAGVVVDELAFGAKRKFRAAGAELFLLRDDKGVTATDVGGAILPTRIDDGDVWVCIEQCRK